MCSVWNALIRQETYSSTLARYHGLADSCSYFQTASSGYPVSLAHPQVIEELRAGIDTRHEQPVACAGAGNV